MHIKHVYTVSKATLPPRCFFFLLIVFMVKIITIKTMTRINDNSDNNVKQFSAYFYILKISL